MILNQNQKRDQMGLGPQSGRRGRLRAVRDYVAGFYAGASMAGQMMQFVAGFAIALLLSGIVHHRRDPVIVALGDDMRCLGAYPSLADAKEMYPAAHTFIPVFPDWSHK